ncbi:hypothetical protein KAT80_00235 [Candidatus Pacearchaeota archaeon]|nr:hypothetical protein [Candidatus Pacearchaeota archaeon]
MVWTRNEIREYQPRDNEKLIKLYRRNNLSTEDPEGIAKFLAENYLGFTMTDHDLVMRKAANEGRPATLNFMEDMAIGFLEKE